MKDIEAAMGVDGDDRRAVMAMYQEAKVLPLCIVRRALIDD